MATAGRSCRNNVSHTQLRRQLLRKVLRGQFFAKELLEGIPRLAGLGDQVRQIQKYFELVLHLHDAATEERAGELHLPNALAKRCCSEENGPTTHRDSRAPVWHRTPHVYPIYFDP